MIYIYKGKISFKLFYFIFFLRYFVKCCKNRKVSVEEGQKLASEWNCIFLEASAKHNLNISNFHFFFFFEIFTSRTILNFFIFSKVKSLKKQWMKSKRPKIQNRKRRMIALYFENLKIIYSLIFVHTYFFFQNKGSLSLRLHFFTLFFFKLIQTYLLKNFEKLNSPLRK